MILEIQMSNLLSQLSIHEGSTHYTKRIGRGEGSGQGSTAGKGHKGQKARSGGKVHVGFEGGQMPLIRRLPKFGFTNAKFKKSYEIVTTGQLNQLDGDVNLAILQAAGMVKNGNVKVKILTNGELTKNLKVQVSKVSESAKAAIEKAGGTVEVI
jgi:large subunit ribosomal protein L15